MRAHAEHIKIMYARFSRKYTGSKETYASDVFLRLTTDDRWTKAQHHDVREPREQNTAVFFSAAHRRTSRYQTIVQTFSTVAKPLTNVAT